MQDYKISLSPDFTKQLNNIREYLTYECYNANAFSKIAKSIDYFLSVCKDFPEMYPLIESENATRKNLRKIRIDNFIVIYWVDHVTHTIHISHIFYGRQNWKNMM